MSSPKIHVEESTASPSPEDLETLAMRFADDFEQHGHVFATAESCTGGLISGTITAISGSSQWFDRAFVTYSNEAKVQMLGVKAETLEAFGAVSVETACEMVAGALAHSNADVAVAVTGIAGPTGGTPDKPVGTVCIGLMSRTLGKPYACCFHFQGDRAGVRAATVQTALEGLLSLSAGTLPACYTFTKD